INLIIGLNATGKTRLISVISNLAKILAKKKMESLDGHWELEFLNGNGVFNYKLEISNKIVAEEEIKKDGILLLKRTKEAGQIMSSITKKMNSFAPPKEELTLRVRRDQKEYPFLEELYNWANNFYGYTFANASPHQVTMPNPDVPETKLEDLGTVPYLLVEALQKQEIKKRIMEDFSTIGYPTKEIAIVKQNIAGIGLGIPFVEVQEKDLECSTSQFAMSQGMYRAFALLVIIEYILSIKRPCTIVIDDLGEGLDFERSSKIMNLIFDKIRDTNIQLIVTSNDRFLINTTNIKYLNLLERTGHVVTAFNYVNNKEKFDEFELTGLNNFDFFSRKMYKENKND
ncbi:MAG: AAA family ATPase, partial [bacterium]